MKIFTASRANTKLMVEQGGTVYEVEARDSITLTREKNKASVLTAEIIRNCMGGKYLTPEIGDMVAFSLDGGDPDFVGYILETDKHERDWVTVTAYDQLWYMSQNQHDWVFEDMTATEIVKELCEMWEFGYSENPVMRNSGYKISSLICEGQSLLDSIQQAIDITKNNTGKDYYIYDNGGYIEFADNAYMSGKARLEISAANIQSYSFAETALSDFYTAAVINGESGSKSSLTAEQLNPSWAQDGEGDGETSKTARTRAAAAPIAGTGLTEEQLKPDWVEGEDAGDKGDTKEQYAVTGPDEKLDRYGLIIYYGDVEEGEDPKDKAQKILNLYQDPAKKLSLSGVIGNINVRGGTPVLVNMWDPVAGDQRMETIRGWYTVDSVTHTVERGCYTMDMELTLLKEYGQYGTSIANDKSKPVNQELQSADWLGETTTVTANGAVVDKGKGGGK